MIEFEDHVKAHQAAPILGKTLTDFLTAPPQETSLPTKRLDMHQAMASIQANNHWHDLTLRLVGRLVRDGLTDEDILAKAGEFQCKGYSLEQTVDELRVMIDGARRKGFDQIKSQPAVMDISQSPNSTEPLLKRLSDIRLQPIEFLVDGLIPANSLTSIFGSPGSGKSFIGIDVAMSVSTNSEFHGRPTKSGKTIYVAGEGYNGLVQRGYAWLVANGVAIEDADIFISRTSVDLPEADARDILFDEINKVLEPDDQLALLVVDTVSRNFGPLDENQTADMRRFVAAVDEIKDKFGCTVLLIHHSGHYDKSRARGSIALKAALDAEFLVEKRDSSLFIKPTKMKDVEELKTLKLKLQPIELVNGEEIVKSAVLELVNEDFVSVQLTEKDQKNLANFITCHRSLYPDHPDDEDRSLHRDEWQPYFIGKCPTEFIDARKKAFQRARAALVRKGELVQSNNVYTWTVSGQTSDMSDEHHETDRTDEDTRPRACPLSGHDVDENSD